MSAVTILLFLVYCYGLGFTISSFVKNSENFLERNLMRIGFGLAFLPFLAIILNLIKIPADWRIILVLSLIYPVYYIVRNYKKFNITFKLTKTNLSIFIMLIIFSVNFYIYGTGAFNYPYLENDDSWSHAFGVKYISIEKNAFGQEAKDTLRYVNAYPPSYDVLLGILHQTNDSIYWTMKFFNALIISLSTIFIYFLVKEFTQNKNKALFAAFALMSIPAFLSHFIWAISIAVPMYFIVFYAVERIKYDKKWWILTAIVMVTALISSPTHSTYFGIFFILYILIKTILDKKIPFYHTLAGFAGISLSFIFWYGPMLLLHGLKDTLRSIGFNPNTSLSIITIGGTGDRLYSISDFFIAKSQGMINSPIGIGIVLSLLLILGLVYPLAKYRHNIWKQKISIFVSFFVFMSIALFSLFSIYTKKILWNPKDQLDQPIRFGDFLSDQSFLIILLTFMIFVLITLVAVKYTNKKFKDDYYAITIVWLIFTFYAVNAAPFNIKISPFRTWMLLAIPVCIIAAEGFYWIMDLAKRNTGNIGKIIVFIILLTGIYFTSTQQKISINTAIWHAGGFWSYFQDETGRVYSPELDGYVWIKDNLPKNSNIFTFDNNAPIIGMDMYICHWCTDIWDFKLDGFNQSTQETYNWLKNKNFEYLVIDGQTIRSSGVEESNSKIRELSTSGLFNIVFQNQGMILFKIQ